jgi:cytochrome c2
LSPGLDRHFVRFRRGARCAKGKDTAQYLPGLSRDWSRRANKIGPELNGLDGRKAGTVPNFDYSDANKNSGIMWNEETFEDYIKNPAAKIPETKMTFAGVKNEQQVKDLWAYISQFGADGNVKK